MEAFETGARAIIAIYVAIAIVATIPIWLPIWLTGKVVDAFDG